MMEATYTEENRILEVRNLKTYFYLEQGVVRAVDGVDFSLDRSITLGLVGESGCGKSVTARSILQLIQSPPGKIVEGDIVFYRDGGQEVVEITTLDAKGP
jgi:ABC-type dipeptide/oligopeptide/nickel transport system ATPase component